MVDALGIQYFSNTRGWISACGAVQCLNHHISGAIELEPLAFFDNAAENVVGAINHGTTKEIFKCTNDILRVANNESSAPKCLRVIDKSTGLPSQGVVQEKMAFREHFAELMGGATCTFSSLVQKDRAAPASFVI